MRRWMRNSADDQANRQLSVVAKSGASWFDRKPNSARSDSVYSHCAALSGSPSTAVPGPRGITREIRPERRPQRSSADLQSR